MSTPVLPIPPSGENVYKFLVTLCIGIIAFSLVYPRDKALEIKKLKSEHQYQVALLELKIDPVKIEKTYLEVTKKKLDSIKKETKLYPDPELSAYRLRYSTYVKSIDELNKDVAQLDHKERLINYLGEQLVYYENLSFWTFIPAIFLFAIFLSLWIREHIINNRE
jgi:hypothetical protein